MDVIERAFALAQTGHFITLDEVEVQLSREGHVNPRLHFSSSPTLRTQLRQAMLAAKTLPSGSRRKA
jgi:hypothetical protein